MLIDYDNIASFEKLFHSYPSLGVGPIQYYSKQWFLPQISFIIQNYILKDNSSGPTNDLTASCWRTSSPPPRGWARPCSWWWGHPRRSSRQSLYWARNSHFFDFIQLVNHHLYRDLSQIRTKLRDWAVWLARAGCYSQAALSSNDSKTLYWAQK